MLHNYIDYCRFIVSVGRDYHGQLYFMCGLMIRVASKLI